mmetsp:Transcript_38787/g.78232  ORF Transcript_38787/g.78232 Transcript_38787/m.78232 type:complete len:323 (-) Transcript_38787:79-1047(-)
MRPYSWMRLLGTIPEEATYRSISGGSEGVFQAHGVGDDFEDNIFQLHNEGGKGGTFSAAANLSDLEDDGVGFLDEAALGGAERRAPPSSGSGGRWAPAYRLLPRWCVVVYLVALLLVTGFAALGGFMLGSRGRDRPVTLSAAAGVLREIESEALQLMPAKGTPCPGGGDRCTTLVARRATAGGLSSNSSGTNTTSTTSAASGAPASTTTTELDRGRAATTVVATTSTSPRPASPRGSCAAYGCSAYSPSRTCQCNSHCAQFGNCCSDFREVCVAPSGPSCLLYGCSAYDRSHACQCDVPCRRFGNCCKDAMQQCRAEELTET